MDEDMGQSGKTARAAHWTCVPASTVAAVWTLMILTTLKSNRGYAKKRTKQAPRVRCVYFLYKYVLVLNQKGPLIKFHENLTVHLTQNPFEILYNTEKYGGNSQCFSYFSGLHIAEDLSNWTNEQCITLKHIPQG
jgi:hypothetical protein